MRTLSINMSGVILAAALLHAQSQPRYIVTDLGPAGTPFAQATGVTNNGLVTGFFTVSDGTSHAALWDHGILTDISKPGLGGPNSGAGNANEFGQVFGDGETGLKDPNNENFCGFGTGLQCVAWVWQSGVMTALPTIKGADGKFGTNSAWGQINNMGAMAGFAENSNKDSECPGKVAVNGTGPQELDFEAVVWGPKRGEMRVLQPLPGDSVSMAFGINDLGEVVGTSGRCGNTVLPGFAAGPHAVRWGLDGSVRDLGNFGGTSNPDMLGVGTNACSINNQGQIAGQAVLKGNQVFHPFLWTEGTGMQDLGVLKGDLVGAALSMNNRGQIVGASVSAPGPATGDPRAFFWEGNVMYDLNDLVQLDAPLYLLTAFSISDSGEIAGFGVDDDGNLHGFLAAPNRGQNGGLFTAAAPGSKQRQAMSVEARRFFLQHFNGNTVR